MTRHERRRARAAALIRGAGLDAAAFVPGPGFDYLTGLNFPLMERPTLLFLTADAGIHAIMPELERLKWGKRLPRRGDRLLAGQRRVRARLQGRGPRIGRRDGRR